MQHKRNTLFCLLGLGVLTWGGVHFATSASSDPSTAADGKPVYQKNCAMCHGAEGKPKPGMGKAPDFTSSDYQKKYTDEELTKAIEDGVGAMPPYKKILKPAQINSAVAFIRTLAKQAG